MNTQRGFLLAGPVLYGAIAAGALVVGLSVALKVQSSRLDAAKAELSLCTSLYNQALASIQHQNQAVRELERASKAAQERAQEAQERARAENKGLVRERERLAALKPPPAGPCPSGQAVQRIREGLR